MNNLSSYCGLVDAKIRAFDKDLPVHFDTLSPRQENKVYTKDEYYFKKIGF